MSDTLLLYENITELLTLAGVAKKNGRRPTQEDLGVIRNAGLVVDTETKEIVWVGEMPALPQEYASIVNVYSGEGEIWLPELVECHTHLVFAGERYHDFALRSCGKTYQQIAAEGGGILTTLAHTREASFEELLESAKAEIERFSTYGVGTIEIKSGYGLSLESELKILHVIQALQHESSVQLIPTFMPAHAVPPEFKGKADSYVDEITKEWIPEISRKGLATYFDAFIEEGFFSLEQTRKMCEKAKEHGFKIKLHSDQFTSLGGTSLAVALEAESVDHLESVSEKDSENLAKSNTVAVLCPGASLFTGTRYAPARKLIDQGARVALSTDYNPGTCPSRNLPLMTTLACAQMKMTVPEAIASITYNAAAALGLSDKIGSLEPGKLFRACQLKSTSYEVLPYCFGELA